LGVSRILDLTPAPLIRMFARPYVAGDSLERALAVAHQLLADAGIVATLDLLAEEVRGEERAQENLATYVEMIHTVASDPRFATPRDRPTLSLKLSSFTTAPLDRGGDACGSREVVQTFASEVRRLGVLLTIDMEEHYWTDFTLDASIDFY